MGKSNQNNGFQGRRASRSLAAISLAASLAAFGCTTNHNLGNGTPTRSGPDVRTAPTSGVTSGGETNTPPTPPPMTSSYTRAEVMPRVTARSVARGTSARGTSRGTSRVIRRSPDEAAAIMAGRQALSGRYLGVVSPALSGHQYVSANVRTGAFQNPALRTNPQQTVNSSISSDPTAVISSGAGEGVAGATGGTTAAATISGTATTGTGTLPTVASANIPTVTAASAGTTAAGTTDTTMVTAPATVTTLTPTGSARGNVRVLRSTSGTVTVTNTRSSTTTSGRNQ